MSKWEILRDALGVAAIFVTVYVFLAVTGG